MKNKTYYIYILASDRNGTLYIGVTSNLIQRVYQHKQKMTAGFSKQHHIDKLVYYEETACTYSALTREKQLKTWKRAWKIRLIEENNPDWYDLYAGLLG